MKDLDDFLVYEKVYINMEIGDGREIDRRLELQNVFHSFIFSKNKNNQMEFENEEESDNDRYQTKIKSKAMKCYQVEAEGRVRTYTSVFDRLINKD